MHCGAGEHHRSATKVDALAHVVSRQLQHPALVVATYRLDYIGKLSLSQISLHGTYASALAILSRGRSGLDRAFSE